MRASIIPLRKGVGIMSGLYRIPAAHFRARAVMSNTPPTIPYRSAGRPEAMFVIERLIDMACDLHGFDPVKLRRRNLIRPDELPYRNPTGVTYDNGEYERAMDDALRLGEWDGLPSGAREAKKRGKLRGIGLANYIELTMGNPRERAEVIVRPEGVEVIVGTLSSGQGHETSFTQCVSEWLGVPFEEVRLVQGDTDIVPVGGGSHSGRSMRFAGVVMGRATDKVIERGREIASLLLNAGNKPVNSRRASSAWPRAAARSACSRWRARRSSATTCRSICRARSPPSMTRCSRSAAFPMAAMSARSRSIPTPARSKSCVMPRSTMSAAPSIP